MSASQELALLDDPEDSGLSSAQVKALDRLAELGAAPRSSKDEPWSSDPQIRAYQIMFEGKLGGSDTKNGRKKRAQHERAAAGVADHVRTKLQSKMKNALDRALEPEAGHKVNLEAIKLGLDIEHKEDELVLKEVAQDHELEGNTKEELVAALFELVTESNATPHIRSAIEEIEEAVVIGEEDEEDDGDPSLIKILRDDRATPRASSNGSNGRNARRNGSEETRVNRPKGKRTLKKIARKRPAN